MTMQKIQIVDMTLRAHGQAEDQQLSFKEKVETARQLDKLKVDIIEMPDIADAQADAILLRSICNTVQHAKLSFTVRSRPEEIESVWSAISCPDKARLKVSLPVSTVQMEYLYGKKAPAMLEIVRSQVAACAQKCKDVEFSAEDASRGETEFLYEVLGVAIEAGATTVTLCDSAGVFMADEMHDFVKKCMENMPALSGVSVGVQCSNDLKVGVACAFSAIKAGVSQIKTAAGKTALPSLKSIAQVLKARGSAYGIVSSLDGTGISPAIEKMAWLTLPKRRQSTPFENPLVQTDVEMVLDSATDRTIFDRQVRDLGYELSDEDSFKVYAEFQRVARKKNVGSKEIEAIIASTALQVPPTYELVSYVINSGNTLTPTAHIALNKKGETLQGLSIGDGPIDAAFLAIEQIVGHHYELDDFQIQAVTQGREAMGDALVKLRYRSRLYSGKGISTDIIGASIRAYLNALNKIVYEENA